MSPSAPTLHLMCGKIAAGKSTLAARLGREQNAIVIAEDDWLNALFSDQMASVADYVRVSEKLRAALAPHVVSVLNAGVSVVLDFPANTIETRGWMREILKQTSASHQMHVLEVSDEVCLARLHARNSKGDHPFAATEAQFRQVSKHYVPPGEDEGFVLTVHHDTA